TRPQGWGFGGNERVALVLDNSSTLAALSADCKTRWEHARARERGVVGPGAGGSRYWVAGTQRTIASPRFEESDAALATLDRLRVITGGRPVFPDVTEPGSAGARSVLITDGVADLMPPPQTETLS